MIEKHGKISKQCIVCNRQFFVYPSDKKKLCSRKCMGLDASKRMAGVPRSEDFKKKMSAKMKGTGNHRFNKKTSEETRVKMSESHKGKHGGERSNFWRGGITPINHLIRMSYEYKLVREACFKRDNYTCIWCGQKGGILNADHIKPFSLFPELRFALDNLRTLCVACHRTTDTYGGRTKH